MIYNGEYASGMKVMLLAPILVPIGLVTSLVTYIPLAIYMYMNGVTEDERNDTALV